MRTLLLLILTVALASPLWSQQIDPMGYDYAAVDDFVSNYKTKKRYKNLKQLGKKLTSPFDTEHEKFRSIFIWITQNIHYVKDHYGEDPLEVVNSRKAVCEGFSSLLKELCKEVGISCRVISGFCKDDPYNCDKPLPDEPDHAWNIVMLYGREYLVDVTWAEGYEDIDTGKQVKEYDDTYFLTPPEEFILEHFPENHGDQLLLEPITKQEFLKLPCP